MTSDLLGISITGLRLSQAALRTTGHNIANAGTDGYSRQRVGAVANPPSVGSAGFIGNGVSVNSIERMANSFINEQLQIDSTLYKDLDVFHQQVKQLDNLLSDVSTGLSGGLESFFRSLQNGSDDPTSIPARQLIVSEAKNLSDRFNNIFDRMSVIEAGVVDGMEVAVSQINALADSVGQLNAKITETAGIGEQPNDLLDQREEALRKLSELIPIQTFDQGSGQINVIVARGQNLVIGQDARPLTLAPSTSDPSFSEVIFQGQSSTQALTNLINGGELGGLVRVREDVRGSFRDIGRVAVVLANSFNQANHLGVTLENEYGTDIFYDVNAEAVAQSRVLGGASNQPPNDRQLRLLINDETQLSTSDYQATIARDGLYNIERLSDGVQVATGLIPGTFPFSAQFDGLELVFDSGTFRQGDTFLLQPTLNGAKDFSRSIVNPSDLAFGSPLLSDASIGNVGTGQISPGKVISLTDQDGNALPLLNTPGEMRPPLIIRFASPTSYDVLDNSDPGNPIHLDPPLRDQRFIPGVNNAVFSEDMGETVVTTQGPLIGLPEGRQPVAQAALQIASATSPGFTVFDFSASGDQFSFDVVVSNSISGTVDGTHTVTVNSPGLLSESALLSVVNAQLSTTPVIAYTTDAGSLGFRFTQPGYGDISVQNYNADPDGGGDNSPVGQANNLLGFDIEGSSYTTVADVDGVSGSGTLTNGYPFELITISREPEREGASPDSVTLNSPLHASARQIASELSNIAGVDANAHTFLAMTDMRISGVTPLQFNLNGEDLLPYQTDSITGQSVLADGVPNPATHADLFNNYLADSINSNETLTDSGIYSVAGRNPVSGAVEVRVFSSEGDDLNVSFTGQAGESIAVNDGNNPNVNLVAAGNSVSSTAVVGGEVDITLADGLSLATTPPQSLLLGDTTASNFARSNYYGIQVELNGAPAAGDTFTLGFNLDAALDNRNAIDFVNLENKKIIEGGSQSYSDSYGALVEIVGIKTNAAQINADAAQEVLTQTTSLRNSISGVNLDDEAADLIRFEQFYAANTQVISVARDLFDRLINSF